MCKPICAIHQSRSCSYDVGCGNYWTTSDSPSPSPDHSMQTPPNLCPVCDAHSVSESLHDHYSKHPEPNPKQNPSPDHCRFKIPPTTLQVKTSRPAMECSHATNLAPTDPEHLNSLYVHSNAQTRSCGPTNRDDGGYSLGLFRAIRFRPHQYGISIGVKIW